MDGGIAGGGHSVCGGLFVFFLLRFMCGAGCVIVENAGRSFLFLSLFLVSLDSHCVCSRKLWGASEQCDALLRVSVWGSC